MSEVRYADVGHVAQAMSEVVESVSFEDEPVRMNVYDTDVVMRGITIDEVSDRNLHRSLDHSVCSLEYDGTTMKLCFHENQVEGTFALNPAGVEAIDPSQTTPLKELAPAVNRVVGMIDHEFDLVSCDFAEVSAGSMATHGHLTDFEFEYELTSMKF